MYSSSRIGFVAIGGYSSTGKVIWHQGDKTDHPRNTETAPVTDEEAAMLLTKFSAIASKEIRAKNMQRLLKTNTEESNQVNVTRKSVFRKTGDEGGLTVTRQSRKEPSKEKLRPGQKRKAYLSPFVFDDRQHLERPSFPEVNGTHFPVSVQRVALNLQIITPTNSNLDDGNGIERVTSQDNPLTSYSSQQHTMTRMSSCLGDSLNQEVVGDVNCRNDHYLRANNMGGVITEPRNYEYKNDSPFTSNEKTSIKRKNEEQKTISMKQSIFLEKEFSFNNFPLVSTRYIYFLQT